MGRAGIALAVVAAAASLSAWTAAASQARTRPAERLNVVLILADDERLDGQSVMHNVQKLLMSHGTTFSDYHVTTSLCGPSRATTLSGLYSHHTGVYANFDKGHNPNVFNATSTLPVWLHQAGYETGLVGKYLNDVYLKTAPPGWDDWQAMEGHPMEAYYDYVLNENGKLVHFGHKPSDYSTTVLTQKATDFIRHARKPFFLYYAPIAPHLPAIPAPQDQGKLQNLAPLHSPAFNEKNIGDKPWRFWHKDLLTAAAQLYVNHVRERQLESQLALDRSVRSIVAALKARGELNHTVIVYTSDNGFLWGEHRLGGKVWPYEDSTHVPLVVRTPWTTKATVNTQPVVNIDLAPTLAQLAGVTPQRPVDGTSFLPLLHGQTVPWRSSYLLEYLGAWTRKHTDPPPYFAIHTKRYVYIEYQNGWRELYDLRKDPWELNNIAGSPKTAALRAQLHAQLVRLEKAPPHLP